MNITYRDISHRKNELEQLRPTNAPYGIYRLYDKVVTKEYSFTEAVQVLRYWRELHEDTNIAFERVMNIFETATETDTEEHLTYLTNLISEEISNKVRDAKEFQNNISMKKGKFKSPARKITTTTRTANKNIPNTQEAAKGWEAKQGYHAKPYGGFKKAGESFVESCYDKLFETGLKMEQCDRILNNNASLNKRFDFDKIIRESEDLEDTIELMCELVNTYDAPFAARYNTALENIFYTLSKNGVQFVNENLISLVTDYFLLTESIGFDGKVLDDIHYILDESKIFSESETKSIRDFINCEESVTTSIESVDDALSVYVEGVKPIDAELEFRKFKAQPIKDPNVFKTILYRIYAGHPGDVVDDLTNIFRILRVMVVACSFISPILGIVTLITDYSLKTKYGRAGLKTAIEKYDREIIRVNKKIKNSETEQVKNAYKSYRDKLMNARGTLDSALDKLYTEKQNDERHDKEDTSKLYDTGENGFDFDFDFDFEEAASIITALSTICESSIWSYDITSAIEMKLRKTTSTDDVVTISEFCSLCPDMIDKSRLISIIESITTDCMNEKKYAMIPELTHCKDIVNESTYDIVFKDTHEIYENTRYKKDVISDMIDFCLDNITEASKDEINMTKETQKYKDSFKRNSLSARNKVITAMNSLKRDIVKLTDKERMLSKRVDMSLETIRDNINRSFESSNREAVIRGTILPKASTCIKIAITTGAAWAVQPAIAVIGLLAYIASNKAMRKKERQIIVDDIDIELNMCNRYLRHFEEKGDMEAVRNIMKTQRELQRQRNRLVYDMSMVHNTKPDKLPPVGTEESMKFINIDNMINEQIMNEVSINDLKNGVHGDKRMYHISFKDLGEEPKMKPRIPSYLTDPEVVPNKDYPEDNKIPRICVSPSIEGCIRAILNFEKIKANPGEKFYVYIPKKPFTSYKHKTNKEITKEKLVFDSNITGESWICEPCEFVLYGVGKLDQIYKIQGNKTTTGKSLGKIRAKWSWAVHPRVIGDFMKESLVLESDIENVPELVKDISDGIDKAIDKSNGAMTYVTNKAKSDLTRGVAHDKKLANKKLTRDEMIKNPELLKKYIEDEEDDPVAALNKSVDILMWALDLSSGIRTFIIGKIKTFLKASVNICDPRVKVAFKNTRSECEKVIKELNIEIANETDPVKQRQLKNQRKILQDCLIEVDNKLNDKTIATNTKKEDDKHGK